MKKLFTMTAVALISLNLSAQSDNPFFREWETPFQVPPFEQIKNSDFMPAFEAGINRQKQEILAITVNPAVPTFENAVLALDNSGQFLQKVSLVFYGLNSANTNPEMQDIAKKVSPLTTQHNDDIWLNPELFMKVKTVYGRRDSMSLDADQKRLTEEIYKNFVRGGANLSPESQARLRELNKEINLLQITFGQNLLAETNSFRLVLDKKEDLAGIPEGLLAAAAAAGNADAATKGKYVFTLQNPSVIPFLQFAGSGQLREKIFTAYISRCNNNNDKDNKAIIAKLIPLRLEKARLMGYETYADFVLDDRMAKTPENVYQLLNQVWEPALQMAKKELSDMEVYMQGKGAGMDGPSLNQIAPTPEANIATSGSVQLSGWDWRYYGEKVMKEQFDVNEEMLKPYFELNNVRAGVFYVANRLYGITFTEVMDAPKYYPDVTLWECKDADGSLLGVLYLDFHPRASKRGGAWCGSYRPQSYKDGKRVAPVSTIVCNFTAPAGDKPALLTPDEAETFFHEFGHALAGLLKNVRYSGISGVPRDFVELPSQIMEHWAFEPGVLKVYAKHYKTGEVIPAELVDKIVKSSKYGQGFKTTEYVAASILDMDYHTLREVNAPLDVLAFEKASMDRIGLIPQIPPRYRSTYFQHTMTGGYTAGYYSYLWAEVLDADAFQAFVEKGDIFDQETAAKFRKYILERGGSKDAMEMYIDFRGKEPTIDALLENRGLK
jgi:peptidyl-dipeptidase Dcp